MNPSIPLLNVADDDVDFDWDAAVKEIDAACESSSATVFQTPPPLLPQQPPPFKNAHFNLFNKPLPNNSRQLTLDSFTSNGVSSSSRIGDKVCETGEEGDTRVSERACYVDIDLDAAKTWIYPDNVPRREYQLAITKTALFSNTLVALPTGLGKTLIAAVVMYNYFRWFPEGKIIFAAPSRPLVMQQIEACHNIVGIPQEWTTDMTGLTSPPKRAALWRSKRVFFLTPQVLEKDIQSGACLVNYIVCLVIDEAHRAMGNYSYCVAVRELMAVPVELRILALTATPGSKQQTIQQVIDNLQISTLEYRSESDVDVCPYVHNRKIELMEVPMGEDAIKINNLILDAIQPLVNKLSAMGVLQGRDIQTFSPCDLLSSREKFRQAPPPELSSVKYSEVEGFFGVLITLYHIRKLLSSHGIRPAHEMLEDKLRQGYFARLMTRNEAIQQAKDLMQKSLSHGVPSPKLSKMLEVLVDHFSNHDPRNSRVIIFSNFRGSVRDIMDSLANIGHSVKATQFIGQSSGKTLKGQSQKIQQAVLEKFRMGGYNVIVATSIGEEGLDIMEVDLVICFDANISPLRMIQRMGRTGRKNDGRVVVLACEGTELKGYKRKQATGKTVRKHMQNGGSNSFNFHCSPRMVPHLLKPELQFVELSIEKFVRHFNKGKADSPQAPKLREKLSDAEAALLNNYFLLNKDVCKPSLVAFPHFQAFPSRVHTVKHSPRTGWLIDAMQHLQGLSSATTCKTFDVDISGGRCLPAGSIEQHNNSMRELDEEEKEMFDLEICSSGTSVDNENEIPDSSGKVSKIVLPLPAITPSKKQKMQDYPIQNEWQVGKSQFPLGSELPETVAGHEITVHSSPYDDKCLKEITGSEIAYETEPISPEIIAGKFNLDVADSDLSPRLTNFFISGVVPESPLDCTDENVRSTKKVKDHADYQVGEVKSEIVVPEPSLLGRSCVNSFSFANEDATSAAAPLKKEILPSTAIDNAHTPPRGPVVNLPLEKIGTSVSRSMENCQTPLQKLTSSSCTEDWRMSSGEKSVASDQPFRLRRLRKIGDLAKGRLQHSTQKKSTSSMKLPFKSPRKVIRHARAKKPFEDARDFIDEEAEVSAEDVQNSEVVPDSEDEDSDAYEDSFIDDQADATAGSSQAEDSKFDMMAIYRRSLLTQSPFQEPQEHSAAVTPLSVPSVVMKMESKECQDTHKVYSKSSSISARISVHSHLNPLACEAIPNDSSGSQVNEAYVDSRKRKSNSDRVFTVPAKNLEKEFNSNSGQTGKQVPLSDQANGTGASCSTLWDDQFYEDLDLEELEAQATRLLSQRRGHSVQGGRLSEPPAQNITLPDAPSFDLGIL